MINEYIFVAATPAQNSSLPVIAFELGWQKLTKIASGIYWGHMTKSDTMANTSMNVSLPEALKDYVQERVAEGTFSNPSDYVRALIREDRKRRAEERLDELLMEGINSGPAEPMTPEDWDDIRGNLEEHIARRQRERA